MNVSLKDRGTVLDISDINALTDYVRKHIQVITAHTEESRDAAGLCLYLVAPPFIHFQDAICNRVDILIDIEKNRTS